MALFRIDGKSVKRLNAKDLALERDLQAIFEANLEEILDITFVAHEHPTSFGGRIDTLGIDHNGSPCIIEYKRSQNDSVINQGLSYLRWLLDHKESFEMLWASIGDGRFVDWDAPRVICVAERYNKFDIDTADILPFKIELLRFRLYNDNLLYLDPQMYQKVTVRAPGTVKRVTSEKAKPLVLQHTYTIADHLAGKSSALTALFQALREGILAIDEEIIEEPKKVYIAYKTATNFADVELALHGLKIFLNVKSGSLNDPHHIARDLTQPKIGHHGNGDYEVKLEHEQDVEAVLDLIRQSYDANK